MKKNILFVVALAGAMIWTGCQKEEPGTEKPEERTDLPTWTLTVQATKADGGETKALDLGVNGETGKDMISATWSVDDRVYVYNTTGNSPVLLEGYLAAISGIGTIEATLSGEITGDLSGVTSLTLVFPRTDWDYSTQYGILKGENSIESLFDYAVAEVTVAENDGKLISGTASFENQQSIYRFSFKYSSDHINAKNVVLSSSTNKLVATYNPFTSAMTYSPITLSMATATADPIYAAIKHDGAAEDTFNFTVIDGDGVTYKGHKDIPSAAFSNSFVSVKNISLDQRLDAALSATEVETVL